MTDPNCRKESHMAGKVYKKELMGWEGEGLRLADVSRGCACYWHSCHLWSSFHPSAGIDRGSPPLCNMIQMMDPAMGNVRAHAQGHAERKHLNKHCLFGTQAQTHTCILALLSADAVICRLDLYQLPPKSAHILFYLTSDSTGDFIPSRKWELVMQKSCWIKSTAWARFYTG